MRANMLLLALSAFATSWGQSAGAPTLLFVTDTAAINDILTVAAATAATKTFPTVAAALAAAKPSDGLLLMADGMLPANPGVPQGNANATVAVSAAEWAAIKSKQLRVYLEFPRTAPPTAAQQPGPASDVSPPPPLEMGQTLWERAAVSAVGGLGDGLPHLALVHPHKKVRPHSPTLPFSHTPTQAAARFF